VRKMTFLLLGRNQGRRRSNQGGNRRSGGRGKAGNTERKANDGRQQQTRGGKNQKGTKNQATSKESDENLQPVSTNPFTLQVCCQVRQ